MFNFLKKKKNQDHKIDIISKTASLLIHAAKIDENYSEKEKAIIEKTIIEIGAESKNISQIIENAEKNEQNSNQILGFTKEIKQMDKKFKLKIIETLWQIIYSDGLADMYETNLMTRLKGLMYLDDKLVAEIKNKVKSS